MKGWSSPPFNLLPCWRDGQLVLNALAQHPTAIPEYDRTIPYTDLTFAEEPTLSHVLEDLFQTPFKELSIINQGMRQSPDSGLTKAQFMANFIEADAIRVQSAATWLYSIVNPCFQQRGLHWCRLQAPGFLDSAGTIVESVDDGILWGSTLVPLGTFTDIHFDYNGQAQLMVGIKCLKLWLIWPPTPKNLGVAFDLPHPHPNGTRNRGSRKRTRRNDLSYPGHPLRLHTPPSPSSCGLIV